MKHHTLSLVLLLSACVFDDAVPTPRVDDAPGEVHLGTLQSVQPTAADTADATPDADPIYVDEEPVYQHVRITNHEGKILDTTETGALTLDQAFRVARPYSYMGPSEAWLYQERAWSRSLDDGFGPTFQSQRGVQMLPLRMVKLGQLRNEFFLVSQRKNFHSSYPLTPVSRGALIRASDGDPSGPQPTRMTRYFLEYGLPPLTVGQP